MYTFDDFLKFLTMECRGQSLCPLSISCLSSQVLRLPPALWNQSGTLHTSLPHQWAARGALSAEAAGETPGSGGRKATGPCAAAGDNTGVKWGARGEAGEEARPRRGEPEQPRKGARKSSREKGDLGRARGRWDPLPRPAPGLLSARSLCRT